MLPLRKTWNFLDKIGVSPRRVVGYTPNWPRSVAGYGLCCAKQTLLKDSAKEKCFEGEFFQLREWLHVPLASMLAISANSFYRISVRH